jgi:hypothetical protein
MLPPKIVAVLLLLLLSVTISLHHATRECTETQKEAIIENCKVYIRKVAPPHKIPAHNSYCCIKVRDVPKRDMECIYALRSAGWSWRLELEWCERKTLLPGWWLEAGAGAM